MLRQYVVDPADIPWKTGETQGITFECQVLLSGSDGGPEAMRLRFDHRPSVFAHMHLTSQFQLLLRGTMDFPTESMKLRPPAVHYTDHNVAYGPFATGVQHDMLVLHPKQAGLISMSDRAARRQINLSGRELTGMEKDAEWFPIPRYEGARWKILISHSFGPEAVMVQYPPSAVLPLDVPTWGRYEVVLEGSVMVEGRNLGAPGLRYVQGDDRPVPLRAGADGATLIFLSFDKDALEGGLTGEGLALTAAETMARAL